MQLNSDTSSVCSKNSVESQATIKLWPNSNNIQSQVSNRQNNSVQQSHILPFMQASSSQQISFETQPQQSQFTQETQFVQQSQPSASLAPHVNFSHSNQGNINLNLPFIDIPNFYGDPDKWIQFRDGFLSIIDSNQTISNIQKMYFFAITFKSRCI